MTDIKELLIKGEHLTLECKKAEGGLPKSLWETYSAFANTVGGTILLGIEEHLNARSIEERFTILGVPNHEKRIKEFWDTLNSEKVSHNILKEEDVEPVPYEGQTVVAIHVPAADPSIRPVYINGNPEKGSFKRNYEGDYHCTQEEFRAMIRDSFANGNDEIAVRKYTMADIDLETLHTYRIRFNNRNENHVWENLSDKDFLQFMGGYTTDRETGEECLTVAGLLMFGKGQSVVERFPLFKMDYLDKTNLLPDSRWSDRLTYDGRWEFNFFNFYSLAERKLTFDLKRPFKLEGWTRIDETPIHKAVREAFTNAIIHADVFLNGTLKVEKYDDRLVLTNPGTLLLPIESIYNGGSSRARNPKIQNMMRMIGFGESIGSGFPSILKAWQDNNWKTPTLRQDTQLLEVELTLWLRPEEGDHVNDYDDPVNDPVNDPVKLSRAENATLEEVAKNPNATYEQVADAISASRVTVRRAIKHLKDLDMLVREGSDKSGSWRLTYRGQQYINAQKK